MKFGQLIEYNKRNIFYLKIMQKKRQGDQFQTPFCVLKKALYEVKASGPQLRFNIIRQPSTWHTMKTNCMKLQIIDPEICSILFFQKRVWEQFVHYILGMIFKEKCFSCYILLTDQILFSDSFYFLRSWPRCVLQLFVNQVVTSRILRLTLSF